MTLENWEEESREPQEVSRRLLSWIRSDIRRLRGAEVLNFWVQEWIGYCRILCELSIRAAVGTLDRTK